jgi:glutamyl-tRNA synthetase
MSPEKVVTRFAPSPTGHLNIGGVRAAIFAYLFARHNKGKFIVRIEDTDKERSKKEYEESILESLHWLGLEYDELFRQSDEAPRHEELLHKLVDEGKAYVSQEEPKEEGGGRSEVIRFKNPNKKVTFVDEVRGEITFDTTELKDFVIAKSFTEPVFHFAVVVDDMDEGVTHIVRGEDHISNTPRQILIWEALSAEVPKYAHLPLIMGDDGGKLSKRKGAKSLLEYREMGYLPEAILNFDAFLGWHPGGEKEVFSKEELIDLFTIERVQKSAAMLNEEKLLWFNQEHIRLLSPEEFGNRLKEFTKGEVDPALIPLVQERAQTLAEAAELLREYDFIDHVTVSKELLLQGAKVDAAVAATHLEKVIELLADVADFTADKVKEIVFPYATEVGRGAVLWPMRTALSGKEKSPDPFTLSALLGKEKTLERLKAALAMLK